MCCKTCLTIDNSGIEFWFLIKFDFDALCSSIGREYSGMVRKCETELKQKFAILLVDLCSLKILKLSHLILTILTCLWTKSPLIRNLICNSFKCDIKIY